MQYKPFPFLSTAQLEKQQTILALTVLLDLTALLDLTVVDLTASDWPSSATNSAIANMLRVMAPMVLWVGGGNLFLIVASENLNNKFKFGSVSTKDMQTPGVPPPLSYYPTFMKDVQCPESNEKSIFRFLFYKLWLIN